MGIICKFNCELKIQETKKNSGNSWCWRKCVNRLIVTKRKYVSYIVEKYLQICFNIWLFLVEPLELSCRFPPCFWNAKEAEDWLGNTHGSKNIVGAMSAQLLDHEGKDFYNYEDHSTALTSNYSSGKPLNLELKMQ